jgi:divalent metal cation (Fe/Co/Zn/Cd) transporter
MPEETAHKRHADRESAAREKTLLASLLLSLWAPLATGLGVILGRSTTQLADFIRRTVELVALFVSWAVFRRLARDAEAAGPSAARLERVAGLGVAGALVVSGTVMAVVAAVRAGSFLPGGNVYPGLVVAVLGVVTNTWFWRRYTAFSRRQPNPIMAAQAHLYRAKTFVDLGVILALGAVAAAPEHPATRYVDVLGSAVVAAYLIWSGARAANVVTEKPRNSCTSWVPGFPFIW